MDLRFPLPTVVLLMDLGVERMGIPTSCFNKWWKQRGKELFEGSVPMVSLVKATPDAVLVRIPTSLNSGQVKKQVSSLMTRRVVRSASNRNRRSGSQGM